MDIRNLINNAPDVEVPPRPPPTPTAAARASSASVGQSAVYPAAGYPPPVRHSAPQLHSTPSYSRDESVSPKTMLPPRTPTMNGGIKRSASDVGETPAPKRLRLPSRKQRPVWACLHPENPRARQVHLNTHNNHANVSTPATNNHATTMGTEPVDHDMLLMRRLLPSWERSIKGISPLPQLTKAVTDWLVPHLLECKDVAQHPSEGQIEIEAKVGRLFDSSTGQRFALPVENMVVVKPTYAAAHCRFESEMQEHEHKHMNNYLNAIVQETHEPASRRQKLLYSHTLEIDTFERLSKLGLSAIPEAVARRSASRDLKLRTTRENDPRTNRVGQIKARIIKVKVADLHIYNPRSDYDLRITMNVECNLMRPELDTDALVEEETPDKPNPPARKKDRLSYKHLGLYQIDLTRVDQTNMAPKYELELEVDAGALRTQMVPLLNGGESGFNQIVEGFLDNATWLMGDDATWLMNTKA